MGFPSALDSSVNFNLNIAVLNSLTFLRLIFFTNPTEISAVWSDEQQSPRPHQRGEVTL